MIGKTRIVTILTVTSFLFLSLASAAQAQEVVCPVCGKSFETNTETCPNDGTDLTSLGIVLAPEDEDKSGTEDVDDDDPEIDTDDSDTKPSSKYQRLDSGKGRKPVDEGEKDVEYSDRQSRISGDNRGGSSSAKRRRRRLHELEMAKQDKELRAQFEATRSRAWRDQQRVKVEAMLAEKNRDRAKEMLLDGLGAPLTSLGFRLFWMEDGDNPGPVNSAEIDINITRYKLRIGLSSLIGMRDMQSENDLIFLEHLAFGLQWPRRFSPFAVIRGGIGVLATGGPESESTTELLTSVGAEVGIDSWITPWISVAPSAGYVRIMTYDNGWNSFTFKISVGF